MSKLDVTLHGDSIERSYKDIIDTQLPAYNQIWSVYIGNDGSAHIPGQPQLPEEERLKRQKFSQDHYSCFESIVCLKHICERVRQIGEIKKISDYIDLNVLFFAFQAHAGRIRDCIKRLGDLMEHDDLEKDLNDFYKQRSTALHGCKIPFAIDEYGYLSIPRIEGELSNKLQWHNKMNWEDIHPENFVYLIDQIEETYRGIVNQLNKALFKIVPKIKNKVTMLKITLSAPAQLKSSLSGSTEYIQTITTKEPNDLVASGQTYFPKRTK
jgi:hypothetical protein